MISAGEALERLREGNRRFAAGLRSMDVLATHTRRADLWADSGRSPSYLAVPIPACRRRLSSTRGLATSSSSGSPATLSRRRRSERRVRSHPVRHPPGGRARPLPVRLPPRWRNSASRPAPAPATFAPSSTGSAVGGSPARNGPADDPAALVREAVKANVRASVDHLRHGSEIPRRVDLIERSADRGRGVFSRTGRGFPRRRDGASDGRGRPVAERECDMNGTSIAGVGTDDADRHGRVFRDVRCVQSPRQAEAPRRSRASDPAKQEWIQLFNGRDLTDWTPKFAKHDLGENLNDTFRVENGAAASPLRQVDGVQRRVRAPLLQAAVLVLPPRGRVPVRRRAVRGGPGWASATTA